MAVVFVGVSSTAMRHHDPKQLVEKRVYFILWLAVHHPEIQGRNLDVGTDVETMEE